MIEFTYKNTKSYAKEYDYVEIMISGSPHVVPQVKATHYLIEGNTYPINETTIEYTDEKSFNGVYDEMAELVQQIYDNDMKYIIGD